MIPMKTTSLHPLAKREGFTARAALTLVVAVLVSVLTVFSSTSAWAGGMDVGSGGQGQGTNPGTTTPSNPPAGGSAPTYRYFSYITPAEYTYGLCPATDAQGQALLGRSIRWRGPGTLSYEELKSIALSGDSRGNNNWAEHGVEQLSSTCLYPPSYTDRTETAVVQSTASIEIIAPRRETLASGTQVSSWGQGDHSISALRNSRTEVHLGWTPSEVGQYSGTARTTMQTVTVRHWNGKHPITGETFEDAIVAIGGTYIANPASARGTQTCSGWVPDAWVAYDESACGEGNPNANPVTYQCSATPPATANGELLDGTKRDGRRAGEMSIMRDGNANSLVWTLPTFSSPTLQTINGQSTRLLRSGTPDHDGDVDISVAGGANILNRDLKSTPWVPGLQSSWDARFYWASTAGTPTVLTPQVRTDATLLKRSVQVVTVNSDGGWVTQEVVTPIRTVAVCSGNPVTINVLRAVNS